MLERLPLRQKTVLSQSVPPLWRVEPLCMLHLLLILSLLLPPSSEAQTVRPLPTQDQLPVPNLHCVFQDSEGFLWYGTAGGGLCRDNGYQVDVFRSDVDHPGLLAHNDVYSIAEDAQGNIWFGTPAGTYMLRKQTYSVEPVSGLTSATGGLVCDRQGCMWVNDQKGIYAFSPDGELIFQQEMGETGALLEDSAGDIWFSAWHSKVWKRSSGGGFFEKQLWESDIQPYHMVEAPAEGGFWVATEGSGIVFYRPSTGEIIPQPVTQGQRDKTRILSMLQDKRNGTLWASTYEDLYAYQPEGTQLQAVTLNAQFPSGYKLIDRLFQDADGNIYVSGFYPYTLIITPSHHSIRRWSDTIALPDGTPPCPIFANGVVADGEQLWVWHTRLGILLYDMATGNRLWDGNKRLSVPCADREGGGAWCVSDRKWLTHLSWDGHKVVQETEAELPHNVDVMLAARNGSLLFGTIRGIYSYTPSTGQVACLHEASRLTLALADGHDGSVYFSINTEGAFRLQGDELHPLGGLPSGEQIVAFTEAPNGIVWAATDLGAVYTLSAGSDSLVYNRFLSDLGMSSILDLHADRTGHIWVLTPTRLWETNPATHAFRSHRNTDHSLDVSVFSGLDAYDATHMIVSGLGAFSLIPSNDELDQTVPSANDRAPTAPLLTAFTIGREHCIVPPGDTLITVPADGGTLVLMVSTLQGLRADRVSFAYQTDDMKDDWQHLPEGENRIYLGTLSAGDHIVRVQATDTEGRWLPQITTLLIRRECYWWETPWARAAVVVLALLLLILLMTIGGRIRHLHALLRLRRRLAIDEIALQPDDVEKAHAQEGFLRKVRDVAEQHLDDPDYDTNRFAADLGMSRMSFYRALEPLTGLTPKEFLRDMRLKRAAALLTAHPNMSITEIADATGFAYASYFTKCFKAKFGVLPTAYRHGGEAQA